MENYYEILGLKSSATQEEIRRAYRILARRYHPDVNPGKQSEERFKVIANAYSVLSDQNKRAAYDLEWERNAREQGFRTYKRQEIFRARERYEEVQSKVREAQARASVQQTARAERTKEKWKSPSLFSEISSFATDKMKRLRGSVQDSFTAAKNSFEGKGKKISVIEVSLNVKEAIFGLKKTIEIAEPEGARKVSVAIPPGVRPGSVVHLRSKDLGGEDLVLIIRVAYHPYISLSTKGIVVEVPITVREAISGISLQVPTLESPQMIRVPPGSQSGTEIRLKGHGVQNKDGSRGDIFYRLMVRVPESSLAVGIGDKASEFDKYYERDVRSQLPDNLYQI